MSAPPTVAIMWRRRIAALAVAALVLILLVWALGAAFGAGDEQTAAPLPVTTTPPSLPGDAGTRDERSAAERRRARSREVGDPAGGATAAPSTSAPVAPAAPAAGSGPQAPAASDGSSGTGGSEGVRDSQTGGAGPAPDRDTGGAAAP